MPVLSGTESHDRRYGAGDSQQPPIVWPTPHCAARGQSAGGREAQPGEAAGRRRLGGAGAVVGGVWPRRVRHGEWRGCGARLGHECERLCPKQTRGGGCRMCVGGSKTVDKKKGLTNRNFDFVHSSKCTQKHCLGIFWSKNKERNKKNWTR